MKAYRNPGAIVRHVAIIHCERPKGTFELVPVQTKRFAVGRCGHRIHVKNRLFIQETRQEVVDTVAAAEWTRRKMDGVRPLGAVGFLLGRSPHRCDACRRKKQLAGAIVCPVCTGIIVFGDVVAIVPHQAEHFLDVKDAFRPHITRTKSGDMITCSRCGPSARFPFIWTGDAVLSDQPGVE